jgi:hypothetical protein
MGAVPDVSVKTTMKTICWIVPFRNLTTRALAGSTKSLLLTDLEAGQIVEIVDKVLKVLDSRPPLPGLSPRRLQKSATKVFIDTDSGRLSESNGRDSLQNACCTGIHIVLTGEYCSQLSTLRN